MMPTPPSQRQGFSLIIVMGLLTVLTLLAVAFARAMRDSRWSSRTNADSYRADLAIQVALNRAMEHINETTPGTTYPDWSSTDAADATCSFEVFEEPRCSILSGEAASQIPASLWNDAIAAASNCHWLAVTDATGRTNARIAFLVVNCSGLLDVNEAGGTPRGDGLSPREIDFYSLPDVTNRVDTNRLEAFFTHRDVDTRYETVAEIPVNGNVLSAVSNLFIYSYDLNRDEFFISADDLGTPSFQPVGKCELYSTPPPSLAPDRYTGDSSFEPGYFSNLVSIINESGYPDARFIAWNIVNFQDDDRVPQNDSPTPWMTDLGQEAVPLINEIALELPDPLTNIYQLVIETWFPFAPAEVHPTNNFELVVLASGSPLVTTNLLSVTNYAGSVTAGISWCFVAPISEMVYGTATEFLCSSSPIPCRISLPGNLPVSPTAPLYVSARIVQHETDGNVWPVDQCTNLIFTVTNSYSCRNPFLNHQDSWELCSATLNTTNINIDQAAASESLPVIIPDAPMRSVGDLGFIRRDSSIAGPWKTVDILTTNAAHAMDRVTVSYEGRPPVQKGLVCISTRQPDVLRTLFEGIPLGYTNSVMTNRQIITYDLHAAEIDTLVDELTAHGTYNCLEDIFWTNSVATALGSFQAVAGNNDIVREDPLRKVVELLTFRQNLFTIILAAQALAPDSQTVVAERRALAVVCRDAYSGEWFVRFTKPLSR